eukprot:7383158-Prymnesium_polylepis.1
MVLNDSNYITMNRSIMLYRRYAPVADTPHLFFENNSKYIKYDATRNWWTSRPPKIIAPGAVPNYKELRQYERDELKRKYRADTIEYENFLVMMQEQFTSKGLGSIWGKKEDGSDQELFTQKNVKSDTDVAYWKQMYQESDKVVEEDAQAGEEVQYAQDELDPLAMDDDDDENRVVVDDDEDDMFKDYTDVVPSAPTAPAPSYVTEAAKPPTSLRDLLLWSRKSRRAQTRYKQSSKAKQDAQNKQMQEQMEYMDSDDDSEDEDFRDDGLNDASDAEADAELEEEFKKKGEDGTRQGDKKGTGKGAGKAPKKAKKTPEKS